MQTDRLCKIIVGKLGSGKTFFAMHKALEALAAGDVLVTNVILDWPVVQNRLKAMGCDVPRSNYRWIDTEALDDDPDAILKLLVPGSCLILDEVHLFLNAREWSNNAYKGKTFLTFLTQGRKLEVDVYLISQAAENMDKQLQRMATHIIRVLNWQHLPLLGMLLPLPITLARICEPNGKVVLGREWIWRDKRVGSIYNTKQTFQRIELSGAPARKVKGQKRRKMGYGWVLMAVGCTLLLLSRYMDHKRAKIHAAEAEEQRAKDERAAARAAQVRPVKGGPVPGFARSSPARLAAIPAEPRATREERAAIEAGLPLLYKEGHKRLLLRNMLTDIRIGTYFVSGPVLGWEAERGGTVLVRIKSDYLPEVRLFPNAGLRNCATNYRGSTFGGESRGTRGTHPDDVEKGSPVDDAGLTGILAEAVGAAGDPGPREPVVQNAPAVQYTPPAPYIPGTGR